MKTRFKYNTTGNWYKGNLHLHTINSDGFLTDEEVIARYAEDGYDFIAITDHWKIYHQNGNKSTSSLLVLEGVELDGYDEQGANLHVLAIGVSNGFSLGKNFNSALYAAREQGALLIWAHPHWTGNTVPEGMRHKFHGIEIYNHTSQCEIGKGYATTYWDTLLENKPNLLGFAVDDAHFTPGEPFWKGGWVMVNAPECTKKDILKSLFNGNFYSTQGPMFESIQLDGNKIFVSTSPVKYIRLIGPKSLGKWIVSKGNGIREFEIPSDWTYARLEIEDENGKRAWSNSLFSV
jgi:hypothetical protein